MLYLNMQNASSLKDSAIYLVSSSWTLRRTSTSVSTKQTCISNNKNAILCLNINCYCENKYRKGAFFSSTGITGLHTYTVNRCTSLKPL